MISIKQLQINVPVARENHRPFADRRFYESAYPAILWISVPGNITNQRTRQIYESAYPAILRISVPGKIADRRRKTCFNYDTPFAHLAFFVVLGNIKTFLYEKFPNKAARKTFHIKSNL
jgi:hypothetical protein